MKRRDFFKVLALAVAAPTVAVRLLESPPHPMCGYTIGTLGGVRVFESNQPGHYDTFILDDPVTEEMTAEQRDALYNAYRYVERSLDKRDLPFYTWKRRFIHEDLKDIIG